MACMQALPFQKPCPQFLESLKTAVLVGSCGAAHGLLCQEHAQASITSPEALEVLFHAAADIPDCWLRRKMLVLLTAAFQQRAKQLALSLAAGPLKDAELVDLLLNNMQPWKEADVAEAGVSVAILHHHHQLLPLLLGRPELCFKEEHLFHALHQALNDPSCTADMLKLLLQALPSWSTSTIAAALPKVSKSALLPPLKAAAALPLQAHQLLPAIHTAAAMGRTGVLAGLFKVQGIQFQEADLIPSLQAAAAGICPKSVQLILEALPKWKQHTLICAMPSSSRLPHSTTIQEQLNNASFCISSAEELAPLIAQAANQGKASMLQKLLTATEVEYQEEHLAAALQQVVLAAEPTLVQLLLAALPAWKKGTLASFLIQAPSTEVAKLLLQAASDPWQPEELIPVLMAAASSSRLGVLHEVLHLQDVKLQEADLREALRAAAAGGMLRPIQLLLAALPVWSKVALMLAISQASSAGVVQQLLGATPEPWQAAEVSSMLGAAAGRGCCDVLQQVLSVQGVELQEEHVLPAMKAAARSSTSCRRVMQLLLAVLPGWSKLTVSIVLLSVQEGCTVDLLLAAVTDVWEAMDLVDLAAAAAREGRVEVAEKLLRVEGVQYHEECLAQVLMAALKGKAANKVVDVFLKAHPSWQKASLAKVIAATADALLVASLLAAAAAAEVWQPEDLMHLVTAAAKSGAVSKLKQLVSVKGVLYQEVHLAPALKVAAAAAAVAAESSTSTALQLLLQTLPRWSKQELLSALDHSTNPAAVFQLLSAAKEPWQPQDLVPAVTKAAVEGRVGALKQLLTTAQGQFQEEDLAALLPPAAAASISKEKAEVLRLLLGALPSWSKAAIVPAMSVVRYPGDVCMLISAVSPPVPSTDSFGWQLEDTLSSIRTAVVGGRLPTVRALIQALDYKGENGQIRDVLGECLGDAAALGPMNLRMVRLMMDTKGSFTKAALLAAVMRAPAGAANITKELLRSKQWTQQQLMPAVDRAATQHGENVLVLAQLLSTPCEQPWRIGVLASTIGAVARQGRKGFKQLRALVLAASNGQPPPIFHSYDLRPGDFIPALQVAAGEGDVVFLARLLALPGVVWDTHALLPACYAAIGCRCSIEPLGLLLRTLPGVWALHDISVMIRWASERGATAQCLALLKQYH